MKANKSQFCLVVIFFFYSLVTAKCTKTHTSYTTITARTTRTTDSTYPTLTITIYKCSVLIGTSYTGPSPFTYSTPPNPVNCRYYTGTDIPAPPVSTNAPSMKSREADPAACTTVQTTVTVEYLCVETDLIYPPPVQISESSVLTTRVPDFCAVQGQKSTGEVPPGDKVLDLGYPYFAHTAVECCIYCSRQYKNLVAAAFIKSGLDCECLVNTGNSYSGKSRFCPNGIQPYAIGPAKGKTFGGPCRKAP